MPDKEKVIKGLECHKIDNNHRINCVDCPYYVDDDNHIRCVNDLHDDAITLLKEQDKIIQNILCEKKDELNDKIAALCIERQKMEQRLCTMFP